MELPSPKVITIIAGIIFIALTILDEAPPADEVLTSDTDDDWSSVAASRPEGNAQVSATPDAGGAAGGAPRRQDVWVAGGGGGALPSPDGAAGIPPTALHSPDTACCAVADQTPAGEYCAADFLGRDSALRQAVACGRLAARSRHVILAGVIQNRMGELPGLIAELARAAAMFAGAMVVFYENDSSDDTAKFLKDLARENPLFYVVSQKRFENSKSALHFGGLSPKRFQRMAEVRNSLLAAILQAVKDRPGTAWDHVVMLDTDLGAEQSGTKHDGATSTGYVRQSFLADGLVTAYAGLATDTGSPTSSVPTEGGSDFDAMCANGVYHDGHLYDALALRTPKFDHTVDSQHQLHEAQKLQFNGRKLVPVDSCFSGMVVYRFGALFDRGAPICGYPRSAESKHSRDYDCEHVLLHRCMRAKGVGKIVINPLMVAFYDKTTASSCRPLEASDWVAAKAFEAAPSAVRYPPKLRLTGDAPCNVKASFTTLEPHTEAGHGDVCRNPTGHWDCPAGCTRTGNAGGTGPPYCELATDRTKLCRVVGGGRPRVNLSVDLGAPQFRLRNQTVLTPKNWHHLSTCPSFGAADYAKSRTDTLVSAETMRSKIGACTGGVFWVRSGSFHKHSDGNTFAAAAEGTLTKPFMLITGDGDNDAPAQIAQAIGLLNLENFCGWYTQNFDGTPSPKIFPIPIGFDLHSVGRPGLAEYQALRASPAPARKLAVLADPMRLTSHRDRARALNLVGDSACVAEHVVLTARMSTAELHGLYRSHVFGISPRGNGQDCHRTWEML